MPGPEPNNRVQAQEQGSSGGFLVPIARSQIREAGLDPDEPIVFTRTVYRGAEYPTIRLRGRNVDEDELEDELGR